jgi:hypothetical protein
MVSFVAEHGAFVFTPNRFNAAQRRHFIFGTPVSASGCPERVPEGYPLTLMIVDAFK